MSADANNDVPLDDAGSLEERLREIEGALQEHMPEDQRLQSSIPGGRGFSGFAYPAGQEESDGRQAPRDSQDPAEPSFAEFYEPGVADVDPEEVLGKNRRPVVRQPLPPRKRRSVDSLKQILADLGAGPAETAEQAAPDADQPFAGDSAAASEGIEPVGEMDDGELELQPGDALAPEAARQEAAPSVVKTEAEFLQQSGLTDAGRGSIKRGTAPAASHGAPARDEADDFDRALAMTQTIGKPGRRQPLPPEDLDAVQSYLEALHQQIAPVPAPTPEPAQPWHRKPSAALAALVAALAAALIAAALYIAYLLGAGAIGGPTP